MIVKAGVARAFITPPIGMPMDGFAGRGCASGVHDQLTATALVLGSAPRRGDGPLRRLAIVCCDLLSVGGDECREVREAVARKSGVPASSVLVASSHNHYGPLTDRAEDGPSGPVGPIVKSYVSNLVQTLAGLVAAAASEVVEACISFGQSSAVIGVNRRQRLQDGSIILGQNAAGPYDPRVKVLRIDTASGDPLAVVVNCACHAVSLGPDCTEFTADFPGVARQLVEEHTGATTLFIQGAAGDVNPLLMGWDWTNPAQLGLVLGAEAYRAYCQAQPVGGLGGVTVATRTIGLPRRTPASVAAATLELQESERALSEAIALADSGATYWARVRQSQARDEMAVLEGRLPTTLAVEISAVGLGSDVGMVSAPGEVFTDIAAAIESGSPFRANLYAGYTNGSIDYVPTRAAYAEGGYEVVQGSRVAPEAAEVLQAESLALLRDVYEDVLTVQR